MQTNTSKKILLNFTNFNPQSQIRWIFNHLFNIKRELFKHLVLLLIKALNAFLHLRKHILLQLILLLDSLFKALERLIKLIVEAIFVFEVICQ